MKAVRTALVLIAGLLALLAGAQTATAAVAHRADGDTSEWLGDPTRLSGETRISKGELIYDDWLYDDYGADLNNGPNTPDFRDQLAPTRGDYRYPTDSDRYGYNAADLRQLRVAADGRGLHLLVFLQTMKVSDAAAVTVAIDSGRNPNAREWPHGVGIASPSADRFITFWGTGGWVSDWRGRRQQLRSQAVNLDDNAIEVDVPWSALGRRLRGTTVDLYAVTGLADAAARQYVQVPATPATPTAPGGGQPGATAVFDAGFDADEVNTLEIGSHWGEDKQAQRLATRDVSLMRHVVDLGSLERRVSDSYQPGAGRFYNRIFRSGESYDGLGRLCSQSIDPCVNEGINLKQDPSQPGGFPEAQFLSPYQPYGLYIPADYQPGTPASLLINGHSLDVNHNEYAVVSPNLYRQMGDSVGASSSQPGRFVITPLARGMDTWYISSGLQDVFEAWDDVKAHYSIDDERTSVGGYSMGGYMTYRMGLLMPDKFAAAAAYVGPPAYQLWVPCPDPPSPQPPGCGDPTPAGDYVVAGNTNRIVYNGRSIPFEINNGGADELVPVAGPVEQAQTFNEFDNPHEFYFYPTLDHFALILADEWGHTRDWLNTHATRETAPDEVRFRRYPAMDLVRQSGRLRFNNAYWVDGMVVRGVDDCRPGEACEETFGQVDAYTRGHGRQPSQSADFTRIYGGPPAPAEVTGTVRGPGSPLLPSCNAACRNSFDATLLTLEAVTFDTAAMGLDPDQLLTANFTVGGGGPTTLTLLGDFPPVTATIRELSGPTVPVPVTQTADGIELELTLTTQHVLKVTP